MILRLRLTLGAVFWCLLLLLQSCVAWQPRARFRVLPSSPDYLLQSPDSHRTPFPDVLKAYNRFEPGHRSIDLRPLMALRIENAYYEEGASRTGLQGFLGTEVARYAVAPHSLDLLEVQAMNHRPRHDLPVQDLISHAGMKFSHYRLYFEIVFARTNQSRGSVLLGANSPQELDTLSAQLTQPETVCYPLSPHCSVFPQACTVSVEMKVVVNGTPQEVGWGSILASIVTHPHHLEMKRSYSGRLVPVSLDSREPNTLLLSLLPGDRIIWE